MLVALAKTHIGNLYNVPFSLHREEKTFPQNKKTTEKRAALKAPPFATLFDFIPKENLFAKTITTVAFPIHYCLPKQ